MQNMRSAASDGDAEVAKTAGVLKLRTLYDFLHRPNASDTIKRSMFDIYIYDPTVPAVMSTVWDPRWPTHQSMNTYFAHLDRKSEAREFAQSIINHEDFAGLDTYGGKYWNAFIDVLEELKKSCQQTNAEEG